MLIKNKDDDFFIDFDLIIKISDNHAFDALNKIDLKIFIDHQRSS